MKIWGHILAITTIFIWSSTFIVSKILLQQMSPLQILLIRFIMAVVFLSIIYPKFMKPRSIKEELLFLSAGATLALYYFFENSALEHTYSSNVSLILATIPLVTGLLSSIVYKTKFFNRKSIIGFVVAYVGVFLIIFNGNHLVGVEPLGDIFAFSASLLFAMYSLVMQRIKKDYHLVDMTRKVFIYGLLVLGSIILLTGENLQIGEISTKVILSMLFLGIVAASLAFLMWNKAIQNIGSVRTNQYIYLVPIITTVLSSLVINEKITMITVIGAVLIIFGLYSSEKTEEAIELPQSEAV